MTNNTVRVANWLRRELTNEKPSGVVVRFELRHLPIGSKRGHEVASAWQVPERVDVPEFVEATAAEIVAAAENDAEGIANGPQRYVVLVFRSKTPDKNQGRLAVMISAPDADEESGEIESEPATKQGMAAQQMRHNEALMRLLMTGMQGMMASQAKLVSSITTENEKLREQRLEMYTAVEDVLTQREERALKAKESEARLAVLQDGAQKLMALAPVVASRMLHGKPEGKALLMAQIADKLAALPPEKKVKLMQFLSENVELDQETQVAVLELVQNANQ